MNNQPMIKNIGFDVYIDTLILRFIEYIGDLWMVFLDNKNYIKLKNIYLIILKI